MIHSESIMDTFIWPKSTELSKDLTSKMGSLISMRFETGSPGGDNLFQQKKQCLVYEREL